MVTSSHNKVSQLMILLHFAQQLQHLQFSPTKITFSWLQQDKYDQSFAHSWSEDFVVSDRLFAHFFVSLEERQQESSTVLGLDIRQEP